MFFLSKTSKFISTDENFYLSLQIIQSRMIPFLCLGLANLSYEVIGMIISINNSMTDSMLIYYIISLTILISTTILIVLPYCLAIKRRKFLKAEAFTAVIQIISIIVISVERGVVLKGDNFMSDTTYMWCGVMFTLSVGYVFTSDIFEYFNSGVIIIFLISAYVSARSFLFGDLRFILLFAPLLIMGIRWYILSKSPKKRNRIQTAEQKPRSKIGLSNVSNEKTTTKLDKEREFCFPGEIGESLPMVSLSREKKLVYFHEKLLQVIGDGILLFNTTNDDELLYKNDIAEKFLPANPTLLIDTIRNKLVITSFIQQDERIQPIIAENISVNTGKSGLGKIACANMDDSKSVEYGSNPNIAKEISEVPACEKSVKNDSSFLTYTNETLGSVIKKLKSDVLKDKFIKTSLDNKDNKKYFKGQTLEYYFKSIFRQALYVEYKKDIKEKHLRFEVAIHFLEWVDQQDLEKNSAEKQIFYLLSFRNVDGDGIIGEMQKEMDLFKALFIASISHELKTPLNCTLNMLELLEHDFSSESNKNFAILEILKSASNSCKLLAFSINDIIDYSELLSNKFVLIPSKFNLKNLLLSVIDLVSTAAKDRGNKIVFQYDKTIGEKFVTDENRLSQILLNLLSNANKYTLNGSITLKAKSFKDQTVKISVSDTGSGIKSNLLKKIGVLNVNREQKLIGLGLTIANYIASILGPVDKRGIFVRSQLGKGSKFTFHVDNLVESGMKLSCISPKNKKNENFEALRLSDFMNRPAKTDSNKNIKKPTTNTEKQLEVEVDMIKDSVYLEENIVGKDTEPYGSVQELMMNLDLFQNNKLLLGNLGANIGSEKGSKKRHSTQRSLKQSRGENNNLLENINYTRLFPLPVSVSQFINNRQNVLSNDEINNNDVLKHIGMQNSLTIVAESVDKSSMISSMNKDLSFGNNENKEIQVFNNDGAYLKGEADIRPMKKSVMQLDVKIKDITFKAEKAQPPQEFFIAIPNELSTPPKKKSKEFNNLNEVNEEFRARKTCTCPEILLVDDNGYNLMVLRLMVQSLGLKVDTANSGLEAVDLVGKRINRRDECGCSNYQIIFMDIDMPEKDGMETTIEVYDLLEKSKLKYKTVVIACTAFNEKEFGQKCRQAGMRDFITKPINRNTLEKVLFKHLMSLL